MFNEFFARRTSQSLLFQNIYRCHGPLWRATQVTRETLDGKFVREEFMRVNGQRAMPQLVGASSLISPLINNFAWNHLLQTQAMATSAKAECVQRQTQLTRQLAKVGLMREPTAQIKNDSTMQVMMLESLSRTEGVLGFLPLHERADLQLSDEDELAAASKVGDSSAAGAGGATTTSSATGSSGAVSSS